METIEILSWIMVGMMLGIWTFYLLLKLAIRRLTSSIESELEKALQQHHSDAIDCRVEFHDQVFYVYNNDTDEFMAQGRDLKELREHIRARWADRKVKVVAGEVSVLATLEAQLNESSSSK